LASVLVIQGPDKGRNFELVDGENVIGRQSPTVQLGDGTVSRQHARVQRQGEAWTIEDLGSANGTYVNGIRIKAPTRLKRGDQIRTGSSLLVFGGAPAPPAPLDVDEEGRLVDAAIVARVPSNEDSVIIPTPEAGKAAIGNLRIIYDLIGEISSIFNVDLLLQRTLDKIFEVVRGDRGHIMLVDAKGEIALKASRGSDQPTGNEIPISRTIINEVIRNQVGVLSSNAMRDKRFTSGKSVHDFGIRSAICVPIKGRERILGVIHVDCSVSDHTYSTEQLRLLTAIGYQTGLAIENVRLYESAVQSERLSAVGETVASLSHHIKNILQALSAGIDVVEMGLNHDNIDKAKNAWPIVQRNLGRINDLILNMLAFSKDRQPLLENVNINHVLRECLDLIEPRADELGVAMVSELDEMPAIPADASGLAQAFMNLLTNALEAVEPGQGVVTVKSRYDSMNRVVELRFIDNGSGIPTQKLERIFMPFYSSKGQSGTGLGLAVAQKIVKEHRGDIRVRSAAGEGTTFVLRLPVLSGLDAGDTRGGPVLGQ
jgi:signal transduction histidine kinase